MKHLFFVVFTFIVSNSFAQNSEMEMNKAIAATKINKYTEAVSWFTKAAEKGNYKAMAELGMIYRRGERGIAIDLQKALYWNKRAADGGVAESMQIMGRMYLEGEGVEKNYDEAANWFQKGIDKNYEFSRKALEQVGYEAFNAAVPFYHAKNYTKAFELYSISAKYNYKDGIEWVAIMYLDGMGVEKDLEKAKYWYRKLNSPEGNAKVQAIEAAEINRISRAKEIEAAEKERIVKEKEAQKAKEIVASSSPNTSGLGIFDYRRNNNTLGTGNEKVYIFQSKCRSRNGNTFNVFSQVTTDIAKHGIDEMKNAALKTISNNGWQLETELKYLGLEKEVVIPGKVGRDYVLSSASIY